MFRIRYSKEEDIFIATFGGDNFMTYLEELKYSPFTYSPEEKCWYTKSPKAVLDLIEKIDNYETVQVTSEDVNIIMDRYEEQSKPELVRYRVPVIDPLKDLKVQPKLGKHPYEDFQLQEIKKGLSKNRHAFFLPMGTGKSYIMTVIMSLLKRWNRSERFLIILPTNGLVNCRREIKKFSDDFIGAKIEIATKDNRDVFRPDVDIVISAYHTFRRICDDYYLKKNKKLKDYRTATIDFKDWTGVRTLFLDESHYAKSNSSKRTKAILLHAEFFNYRYLMTGTPLLKNFSDIYPQFKLLDKALIPDTYQEFVKQVANIGNRFSRWAINYIYPEKQQQFEDRYKEYVSRYNIEDILDLPELTIKRDYLLLSKKQEEIYQLLIEEEITKLKLDNNGRLIPRKMQQKFPFLSLALDNPKLLEEHNFANKNLNKMIKNFDFEKDHIKVEALKELVEEYLSQGKKITIFDWHPRTIESLVDVFKKYKPISFHGQTKLPKGQTKENFRESLLDEFRESKTRNLFIGSQKLLSEAINLQQCSRVIYFSRTYNYVEWAQSPKRFHRIGQTENVIVHILLFEDTLDERLDKNLSDKKELDDTIFQKESLPLEDWKLILKGEK